MSADDYRRATLALRAAGWRPVHDFHHHPPAAGEVLVMLESDNDDGASFGPWWRGGQMTPEVRRLVDGRMTHPFVPR